MGALILFLVIFILLWFADNEDEDEEDEDEDEVPEEPARSLLKSRLTSALLPLR